jgi:hypothetical protein
MAATDNTPFGEVPPRELAPARVLLHHAVQLVALAGRSLAAPQPDDSHTGLEWQDEPRGLSGPELPGSRPWRVLLTLGRLALEPSLEVRTEGEALGRLPLRNRTREEAFSWLVQRARERGAAAEQLRAEMPYALPAHPFGAGAPFVEPHDRRWLEELARWFAFGNGRLREVTRGWPRAAPVRVWPHHFDAGSVLPLDAQRDENAASISVGFSPGDEEIAEPYFYVTPWPAPPATEALPDLPAGGRWHREGWTGAVLSGSEIVDAGFNEGHSALTSAFLGGAVSVLRSRYGRHNPSPAL